jgi:ankyrin repeat protein
MAVKAAKLFQLLENNKLDKLDESLTKDNVNAVDHWGYSLLHLAAKEGNVDAVRLLLKRGIDMGLLDPQGDTALHYAASRTFYEIARLLLEAGAVPNIKGLHGMTPIRWAVTESDEQELDRLVDLFLAHGADPSIPDSSGESALSYAESSSPKWAAQIKRKAKKKKH